MTDQPDDADTAENEPRLSQRQLRILLIVGVIIGLTAAPVASAVIAFVDNPSPVNDVTLHAPDGPAATFAVQTDADLTDFTEPNTIYFNTTSGNITVSSQGRTDVRITQLFGDWTRMTNIDTRNRTLTVNPEDKGRVNVSGGITALEYRAHKGTYLEDTQASFVYSAASEGNVTLHALPADTRFRAATKSGTDLGKYQTTESGSATITVTSASSAEVLLISDIEANSQYYNGSSDVNSGPWFDGIGDASLDSLGQMATRLETFFIGTGTQDQSGTGFQGALLTGVIMAAALAGSVASLGIGPVGGSVIAVVVGYGMTAVGLAPAWFRILLLFFIGIIAFVSLTNVMEGR